MKTIMPIALALVMSLCARAEEPGPPLGDFDPMKAWSQDLRQRRDAVNRADREAWSRIKTKEDWERFKASRLEALRVSLGTFPPVLANPRRAVTKTFAGNGFQIDNIVYETRPGFFVTANLYRPLNPPTKMPGVLIITSHHNPKTQGELQDMGMTWARLGCLVLVPDQIGHGERRTHPFTDASTYPGPFKVGRQDYYFRYNEGLQLHLIGDSLIGWMVWDTMRGIDLLLSRPGIDPKAIILLGSVAGGGDPAAVTAALDERVAAVAPFNFGGPQPETKFPLPADAEARFNYLGGGSWESTRGLRDSGNGGFLPWVIIGAVAPRGLIYAHEFAWDAEKDPVWARLQKIYGFYDARARLSSTHGRGAVTGTPPEATHCNNIGPEHRQQIYPSLKKWFGIAIPDKEYQKRAASESLQCWTDEVKKTLRPLSLSEAAGALGKQRVEEARKRRSALSPMEARAQLRRDWARILGPVEPSRTSGGYTVREFAGIESGRRADGMGMYAFLRSKTRGPVVVLFSRGDLDEALTAKKALEFHKQWLDTGISLCVVNLRGMNAKGARGRSSNSTSLSATEMMLGDTVLGSQLRELRELLGHLRERAGGKRFALWGDSSTQVNPPGRLLKVPLDADEAPEQAEPGAALLALLGGLFEEDVRAVYGRGGLVSYESVLQSPFLYVPHDAIVPGALQVGDWTDLAAAIAPRSLRLEGMVDGLNRRVSQEALAKAYAFVRDAFRGTPDRFILRAEPSSPGKVAEWISSALRN